MQDVCRPRTQGVRARSLKTHLFLKLQASGLIGSLLISSAAYGQQDATGGKGKTPPLKVNITSGLPEEPAPNPTEPLFMRPTERDFTRPHSYFPNPLAPYTATSTPPARFTNSPRLDDLVRGGKIYLSLSDAIILALENNYDVAIQRYNLDIADTDLLRARAGGSPLGVSSGLVSGTIGGATAALSSGGGPGGTTTSSGGGTTGAAGQSLTTNLGGPLPEALDPVLTGTVELQRQSTPELSSTFIGTSELVSNTNQYNFAYNQGFLTGTALQVSFNNQYQTTNNAFTQYSPGLTSSFNAQLTQHLLRGFGTGINGRFILQAKNNRRSTDSAFRQQILYTINQIENIYWGLVSSYEDVQAKERALAQSTQLEKDDRQQLEIGTLAPLDVVNAQSAVASDKQALVSSQSTLEYQQLVMKQAIARNLEDPALTAAPVIPTDRVSLIETPEEKSQVDDLVRQAEQNRPEIEQALIAIKNDEITLRGEKNGLLPVLDAFAFYGGSGVGGAISPGCPLTPSSNVFSISCAGLPNNIGYGTTFENTFNGSSPNRGAGVNLTIPIRNRQAQSEQARSVLEYRQAQLRLQQLYVQVRMQVINSQFALTNDRAQVQAADAARAYAYQSLDAEQKKLKLGASTTAAVLQQERNLAAAENNVITATATYGKDRAALEEILADTLDRYGISLADAVSGKVTQVPVIPGLEPAKDRPEPALPDQQQNLQQQRQAPVTPQPMPPQPPTTPPQ